MTIQLFTFWRSQAAYRVRIALHLKGLAFTPHSIDLLKGDQYSDEYRKLNPEAVVPTLIDGDDPPLFQSLAILDYLDEKYPDPPLLPASVADRAHSRALGHILAMEAHPLIVPRVRKYLARELGVDEPAIMKWIWHWFETASTALEHILARDPRTGRFCVGEHPSIADICLVPHFVSMTVLFKNDLAAWPTAERIFSECMAHEAFSATHPLRQPDAVQIGHS